MTEKLMSCPLRAALAAIEYRDVTIEEAKEIASAALATPAPAVNVGAVVKALEWVDGAAGTYTEIAESPFGHYSVWEINGTGCWAPWKAGSGSIVDGGIIGAKAAAQADYEQRILSSLTQSAPQAAGVAAHLVEITGGFHEAIHIIQGQMKEAGYAMVSNEPLAFISMKTLGLLIADKSGDYRMTVPGDESGPKGLPLFTWPTPAPDLNVEGDAAVAIALGAAVLTKIKNPAVRKIAIRNALTAAALAATEGSADV